MRALLHRLPRPAGLWPLPGRGIFADVLAGITLAALAIPEVMGYTRISHTPVVTGLYTMLLPMLVFALLGASRHLVVAADSATAAILVATLGGVAAPGSEPYVELTMAAAVLVAGFLLLAAILRLGFLADFLSRSALIGLLSGIGVQVAAGELPGLLGLPKEGVGVAQQIHSAVMRLGQSRIDHLLVALGVLGVIVGCRRLNRRLPGALIAVAGSILLSRLLDFPGRGLDVVGPVPGGLPHLGIPVVEAPQWNAVMVSAASCFVVILAQSSATARAYAQRYQERSQENVDLLGLAGANLAAGLSGTFVVNGSPTKTEMVDAAGGRSQFAHLSAALVVLLVLLFFTGPLALLPAAVLSTIVFLIGVKLIDWEGLGELWRLQRNEFVIALATVITVAQVGVMPGISLAVVLSLIEQVRHTYRPRTCLWTPRPDGTGLHTVPVATGVLAAPGILAYRFEANLFYANANRFSQEVLALASQPDAGIQGLVVDASGIDDVDYSAAKALLELRDLLVRRAICLALVTNSRAMVDELHRFGLGTDRLSMGTFGSVPQALEALTQQLAEKSGSTGQ
ncbi:SulP family inorganic anion transporter [Synechococcus sp. BA-124 BA4]|uniref:SulP family inorganic anion transporter n=1 Tax=unclassified Synechococcus TaxID=2626047 RepID=UPI002AD4D406|nr:MULTISPECIES: SulP family inorganic anion transporter [unclassified Synechococcus]MEA5400899.1 SulP family inorganic anion transporter [Synechococcus sp. BA-124 BA4]CAK6695072.1 putative sulfate transporter [Synechococcus sp. CBW1107]